MSNENPISRGAPMSPRPHLFGTPPPPRSTPYSSSSTSSSTSDPSDITDGNAGLPARVLPSDLLSMEDYRKIRYETTKRTFLYGGIGALGGVLGVRRVWGGKIGPNGLVLVGFGTGIASGIYGSVSYLRSEISIWREKADNLSIPTTQDGFPLLSDKTVVQRDTATDLRDSSSSLSSSSSSSPSSSPSSSGAPVERYTPEGNRWDQLGQGGQDQLRDPFFRPGVPRDV